MLWAQRGRQYMTSNDNTLLDKIGALGTTGSHRAMVNEAVRAPALGGVTERLDAQDDDAHGAYDDEVHVPITRSEGAKHHRTEKTLKLNMVLSVWVSLLRVRQWRAVT